MDRTYWRSLALRAAAYALALGLGLAVTAQAAEPPVAPLLRVETGMHTNVVRAVAVDAAGRWAVTASDDRTARVWSLADGVAGPVLRVPLADSPQSSEGRLQAVAITSDGSQVAVAGRSGSSWGGTQQIHVFDRASGRLVRRIDTRSALPVVSLALSPGGHFLAAGLGDEGGLQLYDFASGALRHHDKQYAGSVYALDFRGDGGVLAAGGADGALRVYLVGSEGQLKLAGRARPQVGRLITQARFSPDGELIAVGLEDTPQVLLLDGASLQVVATPPPAADGASAFSSLAWSPDGQALWGGGTHRAGNRWLLRRWQRADWGQHTDHAVAGASVLALSTLPGQQVLFVSGEPAWGVVDAQGSVQPRARSPLAAYASLARQFAVSEEGLRVRYWYGYRQPAFEFDFTSRVLRAVPAGTADARWKEPRLEAPGLRIEGWENRRGPTLNGRRLPVGEFETARSLAIAPDGSRFALGTDDGLWMFDAAGMPVWSVRTAGVAWAVQMAAGGSLVVAALQDGSLRWHRARDGAELLALMPHADQKRWVAWTPSGYFDAAPGAEDLLGWHVNRGTAAAADFHPMWTLRARFRRSDVIDRVLHAGDEAVALQQANAAAGIVAPAPPLAAALPPVLDVLGTPTVAGDQGIASLRVRIRLQPQAPLLAVRARADGRPAVVEAGAAVAVAGGEERELRVRFSGQPQALQLMAENRHGLSAAATLLLRWPEPPPSAAPPVPAPAPLAAAAAVPLPVAPTAPAGAAQRAPRLYVLAVGIGKFKSGDIGALEFPAKDARDFAQAFATQQGRLYRSVDVRLLIDEQATRAGVLEGMEWLKRQVTQHDVGVMFVASHGTNHAKHGYLFITHNFDWSDPLGTGISNKEFKDATESLAGKALFFIDTCHSGNVLGTRARALAPPDTSSVINDLVSADSGVVVFSASTGRQSSLESAAWGNGAFTKSVVEGLSGKADERRTGRVTHKMLDFYVTERVKELTKGEQAAVTISPHGVPDFPLALSR